MGLLTLIPGAQAKTLHVITSIKPLYSLVANVMGDRLTRGKAKLDLLVQGGLDPHIFRLKPSNMRQIYQADVIFYIDADLEIFLKRMVTRKDNKLNAVALAKQDKIHLIPRRSRKIWHQEGEDDKNPERDLHIWLDPANARTMVRIIEETLSKLDPAHRLTYIKNAQSTIARLYRLEEEIRERLRPLRKKPMIVYHDAFQYFERAFGLKSVGVIMLKSDQPPSVKHIRALKKLAREKRVTCVLAPPGAHPRIATIVMSGTDAGFDVVDPLGLYIDKSPDLYFELMKNMADSVLNCQESYDLFEDLTK